VAVTNGLLGALLLAPLVMPAPRAQASALDDGNAAFDAGRYADAFRLWAAAAKDGNATAAFDIGLLYDLGDGVPESASTAFQFYRKAGEAGLASGQFNVGVMYDSGRGVAQNETEAALWYARAAAQGHTRAAFNLGQLYETGEGVPHNRDVAIAWYQVAAKDIPIAGTKARALSQESAASAEAAAAPLAPPVPAWPRDGAAIALSGAAPVTELVWTAPPEPSQVDYFVEVRALEAGSYREVFSGYVDTSAAAVSLNADRNFAWRVYAVAANGSDYAPSPWSRFEKRTDVREAELRLPDDQGR
jgi:hypothetical protein